jgi:hypothetical protein
MCRAPSSSRRRRSMPNSRGSTDNPARGKGAARKSATGAGRFARKCRPQFVLSMGKKALLE